MKLLAIEIPMQKVIKRLGKEEYKMLWVVLTVIIAFILWLTLWFLGYWFINQLDDKSYYRIATKGNFEEDVYFKGAHAEGINISTTVEKFLDDGTSYSRTQDIFIDLLKHEKGFLEAISSNNDYLNYLNTLGATVEDVIFYVRVIADLDNIMLKASSYLVSIMFILTCYFVFKFRIRVYVLSALLYFFLVIDGLTSNLISSALYPRIANDMEYTDYMLLVNSFMPAVIEAALTFFILDTSIQYYKNKKEKNERATLRYTYYSLEKSIATMKQIQIHNPNIKIKDINVKLQPLYQFCKKHQDDKYLIRVKNEMDNLSQLNPKNYTNTELLDIARHIFTNLKKSETFIGKISG